MLQFLEGNNFLEGKVHLVGSFWREVLIVVCVSCTVAEWLKFHGCKTEIA